MVKVSVSKTDLNKIMTALASIKKIVHGQALLIAEECAREYTDLLRENISSQKHGDFGHPHSGSWKDSFATKDDYWNWLGTVYKSIKAVDFGSTAQKARWRVGFSGFTGGTIPATTVTKTTTAKTATTVKTGVIRRKADGTLVKATATRTTSERRKDSKEAFTKHIRENVDKSVKIYGKDSDLVRQYNERLSAGATPSTGGVVRTVNLGKKYETPALDKLGHIKLRRKYLQRGT